MPEKDFPVREMDLPSVQRETSELLLRKGRSDYAMMWVFLQVMMGVMSTTKFLSQALELQIFDGTGRWGSVAGVDL